MSQFSNKIVEMFDEYSTAAGPGPVDLNDVAEWAMKAGRWAPQPGLARKKLVEELGRALREQYITDPEGRRVRVKHSAWVKRGDVTLHLWDDSRRAAHEHMESSVAQRRNMIVDDCTQLKTDVDWYNTYRPERPDIQLPLDFAPDVAEREALDRLQRKKVNASSSAPEQPSERPRPAAPESASQPAPYPPAARRDGRARRRPDSSPVAP